MLGESQVAMLLDPVKIAQQKILTCEFANRHNGESRTSTRGLE